MRNFLNLRKRKITILYIISLLGMLSILMFIGINKEKPKQNGNKETYKDITASWTLDKEGTQPADVAKLGQ